MNRLRKEFTSMMTKTLGSSQWIGMLATSRGVQCPFCSEAVNPRAWRACGTGRFFADSGSFPSIGDFVAVLENGYCASCDGVHADNSIVYAPGTLRYIRPRRTPTMHHIVSIYSLVEVGTSTQESWGICREGGAFRANAHDCSIPTPRRPWRDSD
jgi:hypothetical protein